MSWKTRTKKCGSTYDSNKKGYCAVNTSYGDVIEPLKMSGACCDNSLSERLCLIGTANEVGNRRWFNERDCNDDTYGGKKRRKGRTARKTSKSRKSTTRKTSKSRKSTTRKRSKSRKYNRRR
jgi:hypothetical protein